MNRRRVNAVCAALLFAFRSIRVPRIFKTARRRNRLGLAGVVVLILAGLTSSPVSAQFSSGKPIRIIVPFGPAGSADVIARVLQVPLGRALKQNIIIENRSGAGSNLGTAVVARSDLDGYTLLLTTSAFVANPALYKGIPYDPAKDFAPIADLAVAPNIIATLPKAGLNSLTDVIARAKADAQKLNYASPGNGTTPQLTMELFKLRAGIQITNIAYGGGGPATQALLSGTVDLLCASLPNVQEQVRAGAMKGLSITSTQRWPDLPEVPTFGELGFPDIVLDTGHFLLAPAGTPPEIIERLAKETLAVLAQDAVKERLRQVGYAPVAGGPDALRQRIAKEVPFFKELVASAKIPQIE
jgi:tripartite-type tricarboxylate transporter receptor subunit TctC